MTDDLALRKDAERGARAERLLDDPLLAEIFAELEAEYINYWRNSTSLDDTQGRERLWQAVHILGRVREHLRFVADDGKVANAALHDLSQGRQS